MEARVQKIISQWGIASRREAEEMIKQSRVQINGIVAHLGQKVDPQRDTICIDGKPISHSDRPDLIYLLLNKPAGVVSTCDDPHGRTTVLDLLPENLHKGTGIHPVGRLDADSTGALILTNDGDLTFSLTHPSHNISKTYHVVVKGHPPETVLKMWREGVVLEGKKTRPAKVRLIERLANQSKLEIILQEGRNRQIRRVAEQLGYPVIQLHRTAIGSIQLQTPKAGFLGVGDYRHLTPEEIIFLKNQFNNGQLTMNN
ncbi:rRNA pseudouridine synthase [Anabaena aphanizomenioides LEGE 00250]|jgi:pseudouridine synthase|uniref:Pseudouridine synthase n=1 Tax=Sphaerospermopsis aphanizomenoides LEGE 00250 TaxID=2777972 RepID=A0ABR9VIF6_9CYAN|nr:pseudouridine synthase [Sphaerospermopsis aphanizomenoides]MBE9238293.1 rRNA pseudouridine synthase [Sphaerospermopsis aphanizomenoides LEGE 00250]